VLVLVRVVLVAGPSVGCAPPPQAASPQASAALHKERVTRMVPNGIVCITT
jgi:hypothetical protein